MIGEIKPRIQTRHTFRLSQMNRQTNPSTETQTKTFRQVFCESYATRLKGMTGKCFGAAHRPTFPFACLLYLVYRISSEDFKVIRLVGNSTKFKEFKTEIDIFYHNIRHSGGWLKHDFRIRISGSRLIALRGKCLGRPASRDISLNFCWRNRHPPCRPRPCSRCPPQNLLELLDSFSAWPIFSSTQPSK